MPAPYEQRHIPWHNFLSRMGACSPVFPKIYTPILSNEALENCIMIPQSLYATDVDLIFGI